MNDIISASPAKLLEAMPSFTGQASTVEDLVSHLKSSTSTLSTTLTIDPLTGFGQELETLSGRVEISLNCFTDALHHFGQGLQIAATSFSSTDKQLANTFNIIDQALSPYLGFDAPAQAARSVPKGRGLWGSIEHGLGVGWHYIDRGLHDLSHILVPPIPPGGPGKPEPNVPMDDPVDIPLDISLGI